MPDIINPIQTKSLKDQVYEFLEKQIHGQDLKPGDTINLEKTSRSLGISRTPLRDALLLLQQEGFVTILPRRGIVVNGLSLAEIREFYQIIGALESTAILNAAEKFDRSKTSAMKELNLSMAAALKKNDFNQFYKLNLAFHDLYLDLSANQNLQKICRNLKRRLYDFPRRRAWIKEWEENSLVEHERLLEHLETGDFKAAAAHIRDVHWSFTVQEPFIKLYYRLS